MVRTAMPLQRAALLQDLSKVPWYSSRCLHPYESCSDDFKTGHMWQRRGSGVQCQIPLRRADSIHYTTLEATAEGRGDLHSRGEPRFNYRSLNSSVPKRHLSVRGTVLRLRLILLLALTYSPLCESPWWVLGIRRSFSCVGVLWESQGGFTGKGRYLCIRTSS